ncbi:RNA methyltransferase [Synechococcus sp. M16CYN]|uniref:RNA methyltransferase n=1 Tax=Synechococcus sp. M16CYN TaxID=3103139 RepID=UPI003246E32D
MKTVVVLVEPVGPLNIGSVARLCANFNVDELRLVAPRCDHLSDPALQMAVHGRTILYAAALYPDLLSAIGDCRRSVAGCGRTENGGIFLHSPDSALTWLLASPSPPQPQQKPVAVVFGREDRGLSNDELRLCQKVLTLHSSSSYPSLNLSHSVGIVLHELARISANGQCATNHVLSPMPDPAAAPALAALLDDATDLLLEAGFLLQHTARARMGKVRNLLQRATIRAEEVALMRGMVRQLRWAIRAHSS